MFQGLRASIFAATTLAAGVLGPAPACHAQAPQAAVPINYATSFGNFGRESYAYVALELGYFKQAGFDVTIRPGTGSLDGIHLLAAGKIDFAPIDTAAVALVRANEGVKVKLVAMMHQASMVGTVGLKESGLAKPSDLEGGIIADSPGSVIQAMFPLFAQNAGIDQSKVTFVPAAPPTLPSLLVSKQVRAVNQLMVGMPLLQKAAQGKELIAFPYSQYVKGMLGNGLLVSEERLAKNPDEVRRFAGALLRGLAYALDHPDEAGRILQKHVPLSDPVIAAEELRIMKNFARGETAERCGLGYIDPQRVETTVAVVKQYLKPTGSVTAADLFTPGFVETSCK